jgi:hypothetical protein
MTELDIKDLPPLIDGGEATPIERPASQLPRPSGYRILCALGQPAGAPASRAVSHSRASNSSWW